MPDEKGEVERGELDHDNDGRRRSWGGVLPVSNRKEGTMRRGGPPKPGKGGGRGRSFPKEGKEVND